MGFYPDCVGLGCTMGASAAMATDFGFGVTIFAISKLGYFSAGLVMDKGVETRYQALLKKGYKIKTANRAASKNLLN